MYGRGFVLTYTHTNFVFVPTDMGGVSQRPYREGLYKAPRNFMKHYREGVLQRPYLEWSLQSPYTEGASELPIQRGLCTHIHLFHSFFHTNLGCFTKPLQKMGFAKA